MVVIELIKIIMEMIMCVVNKHLGATFWECVNLKIAHFSAAAAAAAVVIVNFMNASTILSRVIIGATTNV